MYNIVKAMVSRFFIMQLQDYKDIKSARPSFAEASAGKASGPQDNKSFFKAMVSCFEIYYIYQENI
jgi:hypothetical protein